VFEGESGGELPDCWLAVDVSVSDALDCAAQSAMKAKR